MKANRISFNTDESTFIVDDYLTLHFSKHEEIGVIRWAMELFTEWVLKGKLVEINHDYDPPWDSSGTQHQRQINNDDYEEVMQGTLADWMSDHYSGNTTASYMSGCGLWHDTYEKVVSDYVMDTIIGVLKSQVCDDDKWFEIIEDDDYIFFECDLQTHIIEAIEVIPAKDAFQLCKKRVLQKLKQREADTKAHYAFIAQCKDRVDIFQNRFLPWLPKESIDKNSWKDNAVESQLKSALAYADIQTLQALATVGLNKNFSNSVQEIVEKILKDFYQKAL